MQLLTTLWLLLCIGSCGQGNKPAVTESNTPSNTVAASAVRLGDSISPGLVTKVICEADSTQSYTAYLPSATTNEQLPVVYFFDPHANGALPINKYKALADAYKFILVGSNTSKNGNDLATSEQIWRVLFDDTQHRLHINTARVYIAGFSGGAKVATYIALQHDNIKGAIANGAGLPAINEAANINFSFTAVTGEGDMNMTDLVAINKALDATNTRHRILFFNGIHEWAPVATMDLVFAGLQLDAMLAGTIPVDTSFINHLAARGKTQIDNAIQSKNFVQAEAICKAYTNMLAGITNETNWFQEKETNITGNPAFQKQIKARQDLLAMEAHLKEVYQQQFGQGDRNYWVTTINDIDAKAKAATPLGNMYKRLKAYLSLAFYSISNQLINGNQNDAAAHFVGLYKLADPLNSEAWYFSAILDARKHDAKATQQDLTRAVSVGFSDKERLLQQPEFQQLGTQLDWGKIEAGMQ